MSLYTLSLVLHIAAGSVGLIGFWFAAALRKGSPLHRAAGRAYLVAMLFVFASGLVLAHGLLLRQQPLWALFLAYLLALLLHSCMSAWRAVRDRADPARYFSVGHLLRVVLLCMGGAGVAWVGYQAGAVLLIVFGAIGVLLAVEWPYARRRARRHPRWWLREHYQAMIGNGIATHIAFFGIGLRGLLPGVDPGLLMLFAWLAPLAVGIGAGIWLDRRHARPRPRAPAVAGGRA